MNIENTTRSQGTCGNLKARRLLKTAAGWGVLCGITAILSWSSAALATPAKDFVGDVTETFFERINVLAETNKEGEDAKVKIIAKDPSDVYVVVNTVAPGGYSGWHTHPGPSVVLVKSGTATVYDGNDPTCTPVRYPAGTGFIDAGGGHVHMVRNEGSQPLVLDAFQIIPTGDARRIDAASPGYCPF